MSETNIYNNPNLYIAFQEYVPGGAPGPVTKGKILGQGLEFETTTVVDTQAVPAYTVTHSGGSTSSYPAYTITTNKVVQKQFTVFYCYSDDGVIKKVLPENISVLNYKIS